MLLLFFFYIADELDVFDAAVTQSTPIPVFFFFVRLSFLTPENMFI